MTVPVLLHGALAAHRRGSILREALSAETTTTLPEGGAVVTLDITTGRATEVARNNVAWWGAAVTTIAPVAPP